MDRDGYLNVAAHEHTHWWFVGRRAIIDALLKPLHLSPTARRRVAEVPTTWRDRTAGQSNFGLRKWLPHYLRWYGVAMGGRLPRRRSATRQP